MLVINGPFMSMHKWSGRTKYDDINGPPRPFMPGPLICCDSVNVIPYINVAREMGVHEDRFCHVNVKLLLIIIIINTGQTAYADEPRGRSTPQKELNNIYTDNHKINRLGYIVC